jgi:hypothetical protein
MKIKTVKELIELLEKVKDKSLPIFVYNATTTTINEINLVDDSIDDRVDLNFEEE